jgi:hypothetical protein
MTQDTTGTATNQKQALLEAFDSVLKKQAEDREAELREAEARRLGHNRARPAFLALAFAVLGLCGFLYFQRPEWVFPPDVTPETVAIKEASLRIGMANAAQHIERFHRRTGKLPATLTDVGTQVDGLSYQTIDSASWRLTGTHEGIELTLASSEPLAHFIGNSFQVIARRTR